MDKEYKELFRLRYNQRIRVRTLAIRDTLTHCKNIDRQTIPYSKWRRLVTLFENFRLESLPAVKDIGLPEEYYKPPKCFLVNGFLTILPKEVTGIQVTTQDNTITQIFSR